jgi:hypothetical protein
VTGSLVIMVEQIKSVEFGSQWAKFVSRTPRAAVDEVLGILDAFLYDSA